MNIKTVLKASLLLSIIFSCGIIKPMENGQKNDKSVAINTVDATEKKLGRTAATLGCLALGLGGIGLWQQYKAIRYDQDADMVAVLPWILPIIGSFMVDDDAEKVFRQLATKFARRGLVLLVPALGCLVGALGATGVWSYKKIARYIRNRKAKKTVTS